MGLRWQVELWYFDQIIPSGLESQKEARGCSRSAQKQEAAKESVVTVPGLEVFDIGDAAIRRP